MASNFVSVAPPPRKATVSPRVVAQQKQAQAATEDLHKRRASGLYDFAKATSLILMGFGLRADAATVNRFAPGIIEPVVNYGDVNEDFGKKLDTSAELGPIAAIVLGVIPMLAQLAVNHGVIKVERMAAAGIVRPDTLDLEAKALLDRAHAEALADQIAAARELAETQRQAQLLNDTIAMYGEDDEPDSED